MKAAHPPPASRESRRTEREEKRAKQRLANIKRAASMHAARLERSALGEFTIFASPSRRSIRRTFTGCSGWFYWHWRGVFYPTELPTAKWFPFYADHFNTVELNAPFYSWPTIKTVQTWCNQLDRRNFKYSIKVCELITHIKRFKGTKTLIKDFGLIAELMGERMGCFLFQLPPSFHYTPARLSSIVSQLDSRWRNVVEFRHASWWNETVFESFRTSGIIFCSCSAPRLPTELIKTAEDIYVRFHGLSRWYQHDYAREELSVWAKRIRACRARHVYLYFNNDRNGFAIKNARMMLQLLR